ncbi:alpha/beta-hydrolase [Aspergillus coremiiformis]|uniref:Alpha/beta-hydrolase n=1 Tax=Aspergillus coremiiformis TaxID=138285 RepID=A0A5N6Z5M5_9EURO|nr:alpha/beta-hydrolase [Aspergillus coremiiformis]
MVSLKKIVLKISQRHPRPTASALRAATAPPTSGSPFINNSQGASAAVAELSDALGTVFDQIDLDEDGNNQIHAWLDRLDQEASQYGNSQLKDEYYSDWECSREKAQLVSVAWHCAKTVYETSFPSGSVRIGSWMLESGDYTTPSTDGTRKAVSFSRASPVEQGTPDKDLPLLVIAIRGSASAVDHMVNANYEPQNADDFIDLSRLTPENSTGLQAHSGFLNSAKALDNTVSHRMNEFIRLNRSRFYHILFTGHSAGGAVASLLFLRYLAQGSIYPSTRFSCITFGAPPVVTFPLLESPTIDASSGVCLNFINEFDPVTRADGAYKHCLVDLIHSMYNQQPSLSRSETSSTTVDSFTTDDSEKIWKGTDWPVLPSFYSHVGPRIVLLLRAKSSLKETCLRLRAVEVPRSDFDRLLFCRVAVHRRVCYEERVGLIAQGEFNEKTGWNDTILI